MLENIVWARNEICLPTDSQSEVVKFKITTFQNNTEECFSAMSVLVLFLDLGFEESR